MGPRYLSLLPYLSLKTQPSGFPEIQQINCWKFSLERFVHINTLGCEIICSPFPHVSGGPGVTATGKSSSSGICTWRAAKQERTAAPRTPRRTLSPQTEHLLRAGSPLKGGRGSHQKPDSASWRSSQSNNVLHKSLHKWNNINVIAVNLKVLENKKKCIKSEGEDLERRRMQRLS